MRLAAGLLLGVAGVVVLVNPLAGGASDLLASAVALGGALFWGCGSVYAKRAPHPGQPLLASAMEMICAGITLCLIGAASGELGRISAASLLSTSGLALGYLIVFGSNVSGDHRTVDSARGLAAVRRQERGLLVASHPARVSGAS